MSKLFAHTPALGSVTWHPLEDHLYAVAKLARQFGNSFGAGELAYWIGLWHDLGKCNPLFQEYLQRCSADPNYKGRGPDHKAAGTKLALQYTGTAAMIVQAHHGGLKCPSEFKAWLEKRTLDPATSEALERAHQLISDLEPADRLMPPAFVRDKVSGELFLRMLFSTLVDADVLDTEQHWNPTRAELRSPVVTLAELWETFRRKQQAVTGTRSDTVGQARHAMYEACLAAADNPPGLFRLAMPTGGGKTRSGMAFALRHALRHNLNRVIVAVPFISITEQTAATYREIFQAEDVERPVVLEHHSGAWADLGEKDEYDPSLLWARAAAENWDAPIVVTTTVQLFESLFSNRTSRSRKLHRLSNSVIILDEAQALPAHLLTPILDALQQLSTHYGTTVVISTATQPAFESIPAFASLNATDIVPNAQQWFSALKRVKYEWLTDRELTWSEVADLLRRQPQAVAVVNTKRDALALLDELNDPEALHLSTLLCGAHRRDVILEVKQRLEKGQPCRLVSTQVIEAGVDLDFPVAMRALGPFDSIIQTAGRCNREGRLERGRVIVFKPAEGGTPQGNYMISTGITNKLLSTGEIDPDDPALARKYFRLLYDTIGSKGLDRESIQELREGLDYPEVARRFRMIDQDTEDVIVTYGDEAARDAIQRSIDHLQRGLPGARSVLRRLQPYLVSIHKRAAEGYRRQGLITPLEKLPGLGVWLGQYHPVLGVTGEDVDRELLVF